MSTLSHFLITASLRKSLKWRLEMPVTAVLLGSVAPHLPVYLMSLGGLFYYRWVLGWENRETLTRQAHRSQSGPRSQIRPTD